MYTHLQQLFVFISDYIPYGSFPLKSCIILCYFCKITCKYCKNEDIRKMKLKLKVLFSSFHLNGQLNGQISFTILKVGTAYHTYIMSSADTGVKKFVNNRRGLSVWKRKKALKKGDCPSVFVFFFPLWPDSTKNNLREAAVKAAAWHYFFWKANTVKPLLSRHLWDLPKCPLNGGCKNCTMFAVND